MLIAFHKPYGVITQFTPKEPGQRTLKEFHFPPSVHPLGRLDLDSEGLLLLTDESRWDGLLLHPRSQHPRTYHAQVEHLITEEALVRLRKGVVIQDWQTLPCKARMLKDVSYAERNPPIRFRKSIPTSWVELILVEGKNRQVRRMTASVGFPTLRLIRAAMGGLKLEGLAEGKWRVLDEKDKALLLQK